MTNNNESADAEHSPWMTQKFERLQSRVEELAKLPGDKDGKEPTDRALKILDGIAGRDGTIGLIAFVLVAYFLYSDFRESERIDERMKTFESTQRGLIKQLEGQSELLRKIDLTINPPRVRWYGPQDQQQPPRPNSPPGNFEYRGPQQ